MFLIEYRPISIRLLLLLHQRRKLKLYNGGKNRIRESYVIKPKILLFYSLLFQKIQNRNVSITVRLFFSG